MTYEIPIEPKEIDDAASETAPPAYANEKEIEETK